MNKYQARQRMQMRHLFFSALATLERAMQSPSFRAAAERRNQPIVYLKGAEFAARALADYRYKGELIKALAIRVE